MNSVCSPSSSSSREMSLKVIILSFCPEFVLTTLIATGFLCSIKFTNTKSRVEYFSPEFIAKSTGFTLSSSFIPSPFSSLSSDLIWTFKIAEVSFTPSIRMAAGLDSSTTPEGCTIITPSSIEFKTRLASSAVLPLLVSAGFLTSFFFAKLKILIL